MENISFYNGETLKAAVKDLPDDRKVVCQVITADGSVRNMWGSFCPQVNNRTIAILQLTHDDYLKTLPSNGCTGESSMDAKDFLIQQHKTGKYDDICGNHDTDYGLPFWSSIINLLEEYAKVANNTPVKIIKCCICGKDITDTGKRLFCDKCGEPIEN